MAPSSSLTLLIWWLWNTAWRRRHNQLSRMAQIQQCFPLAATSQLNSLFSVCNVSEWEDALLPSNSTHPVSVLGISSNSVALAPGFAFSGSGKLGNWPQWSSSEVRCSYHTSWRHPIPELWCHTNTFLTFFLCPEI